MGMGSTSGSKAPTNRMKGGLDAIMAGSIYAVKVKRKKDNRSKIDIKSDETIQDVVTHKVAGMDRKVLCRVTSPETLTTRIKNGEIGKGGKEKATRVILGNPATYTFEMLIERYGSPSKWPASASVYDKKERKTVTVDLRDKWAHRIGKNRTKAK